VNDSPHTMLLSLAKRTEKFGINEFETYLKKTLDDWKINEKKVVGVVLDFEGSSTFFPSANRLLSEAVLTKCAMRACNYLKTLFDQHMREHCLVKTKVLALISFLV